MTTIKHWTQGEDDVIRGFWPLPGSIRKHAHLLPGRSVQAIEKRAQKISLGPRIIWTAEQDARLREIWKTGGRIKSHMSEFPGHSLAAINTRAHDLNLGRRGKHGFNEDAPSWRLVEHNLKASDSTCYWLADKAGLHQSTIYAYLSAKHKAGAIHIVDWDRATPSAKAMPVYRFGPGVDAPRTKMSGAEKEKKYRQANLHRRVIAGETVRTINPFAAAAGLVSAPSGVKGRVVIHLTDSKDDEYAEAA
jgi:hypothetical protein